jgi:hypothetical protein
MAENVSIAAGALEVMGRSGNLTDVQTPFEQLNFALATLRARLVELTGRR